MTVITKQFIVKENLRDFDDENENTYFERRIFKELAITDKENEILLYNDKGKEFTAKIFSKDRHGNIKILVYTLEQKIIEFDHPKADPKKNSIYNEREQTYYITRYKPENVKADRKYNIPKGIGTFPFIPPSLIEKYQRKAKIKTLVITEGAFKAFKGAMHGLDIIGLSSITHYRDKKTKELHKDIISIIKTCDVKNIILLYDGDCLDISGKALKKGEDLYKRPAGFYYSAFNINELLKDYDVSVYFSHINSKVAKEKPKGLDDLLVLKKGHEQGILKDLLSFSKSGNYFYKINITSNQKKLQRYLNLNSPESFYDSHADIIQYNEFVFLGTKYKFNEAENKLDLIMPKEAKNYFRVGNYYYEMFEKPNKHKQLDKVIEPRIKTIITEDHGTRILKYIAKYKTFVNIPDHINYQQVIHNCYNSYAPFTHTPESGNCDVTLGFLKHLFEEHYELGLDYVQLLYQKPTQKLPILCLVSNENKTGKSTFAIWLREIFINNFSVIGNSEIASDFNSHIASKLGIAIDESFIEKAATVEKVKFLATAEVLPMNSKGKDIVEVDSFLKIILISNKVDKFISATKDDERYWVRKIKKPQNPVPNIINDLISEIPAFLNYLDNRKLSTKNEDRAWFRFDLIITGAFRDIVNASKPKAVREIERRIKNMMSEFKFHELLLTVEDIKELFFKQSKVDEDYIVYCLKEYFPKASKYKNKLGKEVVHRYKIPHWIQVATDEFNVGLYSKIGRPFVFKSIDFFNTEELDSIGLDYVTTKNNSDDDLPF